ncbi:MAG: ABC-type uncharacterized transport system involved in gliding motility auxiliary subunit [Oleiphilaceae bacterium]|jgi:ABC-type uncharacterized transport system involved in gliding motility auxiliary subunit
MKLDFMFLLGFMCFSWGGASLYIEQSTDFLAILLFVSGFIFLSLSLNRSDAPAQEITHAQLLVKSNIKQWKKRGMMAGLVIFAAMFTIAINYLAFSLPYRWDVTQAKQHTLANSTAEYIAGLKVEVSLTAFYVGLPPKYLVDQLNEYERVSKGKITTEIIDPIEKIGYAAQFGNVISGKERKLIVRSGDERRDIDFTEVPLSEEKISNALVRVTREKRLVYFLTGHAEYDISNEKNQGLSYFSNLLETNNIISKPLMLGVEGAIPEDCDVLIIAGPRNELTEQENTLINDYLEQGGDALFLIEHTVVGEAGSQLTEKQLRSNPALNNLLNPWGVNVESDVVVDLSNHIQSDVGSPATKNYLPHKAITEGLDYTFYVRPRSISVLANRRTSTKLVPIVLTETQDNSWGETNRYQEIRFDKGIDKSGPVPISFVILDDGSDEKGDQALSDTRIIVFTDADFLSNAYIKQYSNAQLGLNIVNWLSELDYQVIVGQEEVKVERLDLTSKQRRMIAVILFLIPMFIALCGIFVWRRRT